MTVPVYINVFNRLTTTRRLVDQVRQLDRAIPIIIDNASSWGPLLDWYDTNPCEVIRLRSNLGHHAPWLSGVIRKDQSELYCVTDCDLDLAGIPRDALDVLEAPLHWTRHKVIKSGFGLRIDDLPPWQTAVRNWEQQYWTRPARHPYYWAAIDTTFALYRRATPCEQATDIMGVTCVRVGGDYLARHTPWYLDASNLDEEESFYFRTANTSNSWVPQGKQLVIAQR